LTALPDSRDDMHYLEFYYHCIGPKLSGRLDTDFWLRTILQMAHGEPGVRSALVALGHLNKSQSGSLQHARQFAVTASNPERKVFLQSYNKAIRHLVNDMGKPSFTAEMGLVICLLFACIELLQADANVAFAHIRSGLNIFYESRQRKQITSESKAARENGHVGVRWNGIEQVLVQLFIQGLASALPLGVSLQKDFDYLTSCPKHFTGTSFASLTDAGLSFSDLRGAAILLARDMAEKVYGSLALTPADYERQYDLISRHHVWLKALTDLECSRIWSKDDSVTLSALKIEYYSSFTACYCLTDDTQMDFDAHLAGFQSILTHARHVVNSLDLPTRSSALAFGAAANFTFDTSFIPALFYSAIRCRCPATRRDAVSMLASELPREGLWDPAQYRKVAERVIEIEEMEVDERGWPTRASRLCRSSVGIEVDEYGRFQAEFLYAKDFAMPKEKSWSERMELNAGNEQPLPLRLQHVKVPISQLSEQVFSESTA
jgi:hypothetical protein